MSREQPTIPLEFLVFALVPALACALISYLDLSSEGSPLINMAFAGLVGFASGSVLFLLIRRGDRIIHTTSFIGMLVVLVVIAYFVLWFEASDRDLLNRNWETQEIGLLEFETPKSLKAVSDMTVRDEDALPFGDFEVYIAGGEGRDIWCFDGRQSSRSQLPIQQVFKTMLLSQFKERVWDQVVLSQKRRDNGQYSARFSVPFKQEPITGFAFLRRKQDQLTFLMLFPTERSFSEAYIEEFEEGIFPVD